jgi:hypothetical protein
MTISVNENEYDAISFAIDQIETLIEAADDESFVEDSNNCLKHLYDIMDKYKNKREKAYVSQTVRAEVSKRNRGTLRPRDIDKITRQIISQSKNEFMNNSR